MDAGLWMYLTKNQVTEAHKYTGTHLSNAYIEANTPTVDEQVSAEGTTSVCSHIHRSWKQ